MCSEPSSSLRRCHSSGCPPGRSAESTTTSSPATRNASARKAAASSGLQVSVEVARDDAIEGAVAERQRDALALDDFRLRQPLPGDGDHLRALVQRRHAPAQRAREEAGAAGDVEHAGGLEPFERREQALAVGVPARPVAVGEQPRAEPPGVVLRRAPVVVGAHRTLRVGEPVLHAADATACAGPPAAAMMASMGPPFALADPPSALALVADHAQALGLGPSDEVERCVLVDARLRELRGVDVGWALYAVASATVPDALVVVEAAPALTLRRFPDDPALPAVAAALAGTDDALVVRYQPGKSCTVREVDPAGGHRFRKFLADGRAPAVAARHARAVGGRAPRRAARRPRAAGRRRERRLLRAARGARGPARPRRRHGAPPGSRRPSRGSRRRCTPSSSSLTAESTSVPWWWRRARRRAR